MEAFLLLLDAVVMLVVAYLGLMDDRRGLSQPERSLFRMAAGRVDLADGERKRADRRQQPPAMGDWR